MSIKWYVSIYTFPFDGFLIVNHGICNYEWINFNEEWFLELENEDADSFSN